jgi:pimeloyl-ACP methyl ester carboxylesterase
MQKLSLVTTIISVFLFMICVIPPAFGGDISPADLAAPVPEISDTSGKVILQNYTELVKQIHLQRPDVPPSVLGAVRIISDLKNIAVTISLIQYVSAGTVLNVVTPNSTGSAWTETGITAVAEKDGTSASFNAETEGSYAIYNPERAVYLRTLQRESSSSGEVQLMNADEPWGLISENAQSPEKIPLILVHGDNSYREHKDRWDKFLEWVLDNPNFDKKYEIWRFHHNTTELIGFDGQSGNAKELGDAIIEKFGADKPILILAHSRGGLVSRSYMNRYGDGNQGYRVLGMVTLATPHHGSPGAVPDWGLETVQDKFKDTELANFLYGFTSDAVVNVASPGTMGLAWDNFDGPENGVGYTAFSLESDIGNDHVLSFMDTNLKDPGTELSDTTIYIPDRSYGTLEEMNGDNRYFGRIIVYGGYDTDLGLGGTNPFNWLNFSFSDHTGLEMAVYVMAEMKSRGPDGTLSESHFIANDGMVPLQSALFLKKDTANEPMYTVKEEKEWFVLDSYEVKLKDFLPRMNFRKAVLCPDFDHLHLVEGKGGLSDERSDYWDQVASDLDSLASMPESSKQSFTPEIKTFSPSNPSPSDIVSESESNCFIKTMSIW